MLPTISTPTTPVWGNNSAVTAEDPTGYAVDDWLFLAWWARASSTPTSNPPSGWTVVLNLTSATGSLHIYKRKATATTTTMPSMAKSSVSNMTVGATSWWVANGRVAAGNIVDVVSGSFSTGTGNTAGPVSALTTTVNDAVAIALVVRNADLTSSAASAGWSEIVDSFSALGSDASIHIAKKDIATAGTTGAFTSTVTGGAAGDAWQGAIITIVGLAGGTLFTPSDIAVGMTGTVALVKVPQITEAVSSAFASAVAKQAQVVESVGATLTAALTKRVDKVIDRAATLTAALVKRPNKQVDRSATLAPALTKQANKQIDRSATFTAAVSASKIKVWLVGVGATLTAAVTKRPGKVIDRTMTGAPALVRTVNATKALGSTLTAAVTKRVQIVEALGATFTAAVSASKVKVWLVSVGATLTPQVIRDVRVTEALSSTMAAVATKRVAITEALSSTMTAAATKRAQVIEAVSSTFTAALTKRTNKLIDRTATLGPALIRQVNAAKALGATYTAAATKQVNKFFSVGATLTANAIGDFISGSGDLFFKTVGVGMSTTLGLVRQVNKVLAVNKNKLTVEQATLDAGITGWINNGTDTVRTHNTTDQLSGAGCLQMTRPTNGTVAGIISPGVRVTPGVTYTATHKQKALDVARQNVVYINWHDASNAFLSSSTAGGTVTGSVAGYVQATVTAVAPANAAFAYVNAQSGSATLAGERFVYDEAGIWEGVSRDWTVPAPLVSLLVRQVNATKALAATMTAVQVRQVRITEALNATLTAAAVKRVQITEALTASMTAQVTKRVSVTKALASALTTAVTKRVNKTVAASLVSTVARAFQHIIGGVPTWGLFSGAGGSSSSRDSRTTSTSLDTGTANSTALEEQGQGSTGHDSGTAGMTGIDDATSSPSFE